MPLRLEIRLRARRDLLDIIHYIGGRNSDFVEAERFAESLIEACEDLTRAPGSGAPYSRGLGTRKLVKGSHKIIYRWNPDAIVILRIWDGRRGTEPRLHS